MDSSTSILPKVAVLKDIIRIPATKTPNKDVFRIRTSKDTYKSISWKRFYDDVNALGTALLEYNIVGANISVIGENSYEWVLTYLAVVNGVGVIVPIDKELSVEEIKNIIVECNAKAVVFSKTFENIMQNISAQMPFVKHYICINSKKDDYTSLNSLIELGNNLLENGNRKYVEANIDIDKVCTILNTSGTTGVSKGVMLCQKNLISNITYAASMISCCEDDIVMSILPIHHAYEFTCNILAVLFCEATICFNESLKHLNSNLKLFQPTMLFLVPLIAETVYNRIITEATKRGTIKKMRVSIKISNMLRFFNVDLRKKLFYDVQSIFGGRLKKVIVGGAHMNPNIAKGYRDVGILLLTGYGITECAPLVAVNREIKFNDRAAGLIVPCNEVKIVDDEILVKGDNVMLGYYNNLQATKEAFDGEWFKTGDLGYIDKDDFLYITGRKKNLIVLKNGKNIYPEELEQKLLSISAIKEVVVYSKDNQIIAEIFPDFETSNYENIIRVKIADINKKMPVFKQIHSIKFRENEFKKSTTKKIQRHKIGV